MQAHGHRRQDAICRDWWGTAMITAFSLLGQVDRWCGAFATALHNSEPKIYATLVILLVLGVFLFPPKNDSDQI
jgi:hypothetical protein